jgi:hypothetical protein
VRTDLRRLLVAVALSTAMLFIPVASASAVAQTSASCIGQFFSSHAGLGAAHSGETVGSFISATARELRGDFGATISSARELPRDNCGL